MIKKINKFFDEFDIETFACVIGMGSVLIIYFGAQFIFFLDLIGIVKFK